MTDNTKSTSPFDLFEVDEGLETKGIDLDYGDFYFTVARAGGGNARYEAAMLAAHKKNKLKLDNGLLVGDMAHQVLLDVYVDTVILGWGSKVHGPGKMIGKNGEAIPFSKVNVSLLLDKLKPLFADIRDQSSTFANFRRVSVEDDVKK